MHLQTRKSVRVLTTTCTQKCYQGASYARSQCFNVRRTLSRLEEGMTSVCAFRSHENRFISSDINVLFQRTIKFQAYNYRNTGRVIYLYVISRVGGQERLRKLMIGAIFPKRKNKQRSNLNLGARKRANCLYFPFPLCNKRLMSAVKRFRTPNHVDILVRTYDTFQTISVLRVKPILKILFGII